MLDTLVKLAFLAIGAWCLVNLIPFVLIVVGLIISFIGNLFD